MSLSSNFFFVDSYNLTSMSVKFYNDIFEKPGSSYQRPVGKNNISLLFRPSVIRDPWIVGYLKNFDILIHTLKEKIVRISKHPYSQSLIRRQNFRR